ncbi:uncharacterized protein LOC129593637 [Paramacrobiotus metropolitanus]|uniref:uncharacterized protein LOC129593637 n=1 Tax=Paramacrobiotus metropolitanus TaxID=2943436 RepID=UPI0024464374|nr:uncharacterized protein LOC129593637 [Paramacrobiotus metropolitanus]
MCECFWSAWLFGSSIVLIFKAAGVTAQDTSSLPNVTFPDWYFPATDFNSSRLITNISCHNTEIVVDLVFADPFWGLLTLEKSRGLPSCQVQGNGSVHMIFRVPLRDCGTIRTITEDAYEHTNAMTVMFDRSHLLEAGDQRKVLKCRYPIPPPPPFLEVKQETHNDTGNSAESSRRLLGGDLLLLIVFMVCFIFTNTYHICPVVTL